MEFSHSTITLRRIILEQFVCTFKEAMKAGKHDEISISHRLANFLLTYTVGDKINSTLPTQKVALKSLQSR